MPFKLESFSAPKTRVVHVHHHHYSDSVNDSSEDVYDEDKYEEDEYDEEEYEEDEYDKDEYEEDEYESGLIETNCLFTTSCDEDSSHSGYEESSY